MTTYNYQWQRADPDGSNIVDIGGASGSVDITVPGEASRSYMLVAADVGKKVRLRASDGLETKYSPWSATVVVSPPTGAVYADKRAVNITSLSSTGTNDTNYGGSGPPINQAQNPANFWESMLFTSNDVTKVSDAKYGSVYRHRCAGSGANGPSRNPWWSDGRTVYAGMTNRRPSRLGQWDWYAFPVMWETGYTGTMPWSTIFQFNYPVLTSPPFMIGVRSGQLYAQRAAGQVTYSNGAWYAVRPYDSANLGMSLASVAGKWVEFLVGILWSTHGTGQITVKTRVQADGETLFTERFARSGVDTWQWGGPSNAGRDDANYSCFDKLDQYYGYDGAIALSSFPTNYVKHAGYVRCADEPTALSYLT